MKNRMTVERKSERELVVTRVFDAPAHIVFEAWTKPELLSGGGRPGPSEYPFFPARPMFVRGARTVSCSATLPLSSLWHSSVSTSK